jgi:hypothetical protein
VSRGVQISAQWGYLAGVREAHPPTSVLADRGRDPGPGPRTYGPYARLRAQKDVSADVLLAGQGVGWGGRHLWPVSAVVC